MENTSNVRSEEGLPIHCRRRREPEMGIYMKKLTLLLAVCVMAMAATPAFAQDAAYQNGGENLAGQTQGGAGGGGEEAGTVASADDGGSLPFTGMDLALIFAVGGLLLTVGLGTRRLTRHNPA